jgi:hypothetical protein
MKRFLVAALASLAACIVSPARAVYLNPEGHGQALVFPYYSVQSAPNGAFNTYLSIANRSSDGKVLRVNVREGRNGRLAASFNLFLRAQDMWTATMIQGPDGGTWIATSDRSCVDPPFQSQSFFPDRLALSNASFIGSNADGYGDDVLRLREGYVEVFEMATLDVASSGCGTSGGAGALRAPSGGLTGILTLINVADGTDFTVNAEALADLASQPYFRPPADPYPDWNVAEIDRTVTFTSGGDWYRFTTDSSLEAVETALTRAYLRAEFVLDAPIAAATEYVITLPTMRLHVDDYVYFPYSPTGKRTFFYSLRFADREGSSKGLIIGGSCGFPEGCPSDLYFADLKLLSVANVMGLLNGNSVQGAPGLSRVLASRNGWIVTLPTPSSNGQLELQLSGSANARTGTVTLGRDGTTSSILTRVYGLPAVGFVVRSFRNGTLTCGATVCQGNYGGAVPYSYARLISPPL